MSKSDQHMDYLSQGSCPHQPEGDPLSLLPWLVSSPTSRKASALFELSGLCRHRPWVEFDGNHGKKDLLSSLSPGWCPHQTEGTPLSHPPLVAQMVTVLFLLLLITSNLAAQTFTHTGISFDPMTNAKAQWVDLNNDGWLDLLVSGKDNSSSNRVVIYTNNGDNTFTGNDLANLSEVAFDIGDYDLDGDIDILLAGRNSSNVRVCLVYQNNSGGSFSTQEFGLPGLSSGDLIWEDLDQDGDLEIFGSGLDDEGNEVVLFYMFEGGSYQKVAHPIDPVAYGAIKTFDANNDGLSELLISGYDELGNPSTMVYTIDKALQTSVYTDLLDGYAQNSISLADYNEDGYVDLAMTGISGNINRSANLYQNNQTNGFARIDPFLDSLSSSSIDFGDLNNDGLSDLILTGLDKDGDAQLYYYQNEESGGDYTFSTISHTLEVIYSGDVAIGDYANNGSLDIFRIGNSTVSFQANLYSSDVHLSEDNDPPSIPANLNAVTIGNEVTLHWDAATDDLTHDNSLTYNVYISKQADGTGLVVSPLSDQANGYRRTSKAGNAGHRTTKKMSGLPEGKYYWSVQAIDNAFQGSAFASNESFTICHDFSLGQDTAICQNESILLEAGTSGDEVNWYSINRGEQIGGPSLTFQYTVTEKDTIVAELTRADFGCTRYDTIVIDVIGLPEPDLGEDQVVCFGEDIQLTIAAFDSVNWYLMDHGLLLQGVESLDFTVVEKDTLIVEIFNESGCTGYDSLVVEVLALPEFDLGNDTSICKMDYLPLSVTGFEMVNWYSRNQGLIGSDQEELLFRVMEKDTIVAEVFNDQSCVNYDTLVVDKIDLPEFNLGSDTTVCFGEELTLSAIGFDSVNWYSTETGALLANSEAYVFNVTEKNTLVSEVFNGLGCVNYDTLMVDVFPLPAVKLGGDTSVCFGETILLQLTDPTFEEVNWYLKSSGELILADNWFLEYTVEVTDTIITEVINTNGCVNYDSIIITMDPLPGFDLEDQSVCAGDSLTLEVLGNWSEVNWYTFGDQLLLENNQVFSFRVTETITLWAEVFNEAGCASYDTITVTMLPLPEFELGTDRSYCFGETVSFEVGEIGSSYSWKDRSGNILSIENNLSFEASTDTDIYLTVSTGDFCVYSDSLEIIVNSLPDFEISGTSEVCESDTAKLELSFDDFEQIRWYTSSIDTLKLDDQKMDFTPEESVWVFAEILDLNQCSFIDSFFVKVNEPPQAQAGENALICQDEVVVLGEDYSGFTGLTFEWSSSGGLDIFSKANPVVQPVESNHYFLKVTNKNGCADFDTVFIEVNPEIIVNAGTDVDICIGDSVIIGGTPAASGSLFDYTYQWLPAIGLSKTTIPNPMVSPSGDQQYVLEVRSGDCAAEYDTVMVFVHPLPEVTVSPQQSVGPDESVQLVATGGTVYEWSPEELLDDPINPDPLARPLENTLFKVRVTDEYGCSNIDSVKVLVQNVIFIPNLFTPNGDGNNDFFKVYGSGIASIQLTIYDLHGNEIFLADNAEMAMSRGWDGTRNGNPLPNGTYVWTLEGEFYNRSELDFEGARKGTIRLLR